MTLTSEQVQKLQREAAEKDTAKIKANLPTIKPTGAVAVPDTRTDIDKYIDDVAPASIAGRLIRFTKEGKFATADDDEAIGDDVDFIALVDELQIGWIKFNGEGQPPDKIMGLLFDGYVMPLRESLGDTDEGAWDMFNGRSQDPWQHQQNLVLQRADTKELFTYSTSSITGRKAIGNLLRYYRRLQRSDANAYPLIRLKVGGFQHRDDRVGWVKTPVLAVVGKTAKEGAARPDSSIAADMNDELPF